MLTQERVRALFDYREDGELIRRVRTSNCIQVRDVTGSLNHGYKRTMVDGKRYLNHRLIWLWHFGYFPENQVDHINRVRDDNRIENLREVSQSCNTKNSKQRKNTSSGITGISWCKGTNKWQAHIKIPNKQLYLGYYDTLLEAAKARWNAEVERGWPNCNTTSSALKYIKEYENEKEIT